MSKRGSTYASCRAACTLASMESRTIDWEAQPLLLSPADRCCVPLTHCCTAPLLSFWNTILNRIALTLPYFCCATQDLEVYQPHSHFPAPVKLELSGKHSSVCSRFPLSRFTWSTPHGFPQTTMDWIIVAIWRFEHKHTSPEPDLLQ